MEQIPHEFFNRSAVKVAKDLVGCFIVRKIGKKITKSMITETEAYYGHDDLASHASKGLTKRTEIMFREAGHIYIYLIYGMHLMLNIVTGKIDHPGAVLIRGIDLAYGPGNLTKLLNIEKSINGNMYGELAGLWFERDINSKRKIKIKAGPRIGVDYAGPIWSKKKWRFTLVKTL